MLLNKVNIHGYDGLMDIHINGSIIERVTENGERSRVASLHALNFENAIAFPGLINSHDHLDFNCFPQLGNKIYHNYREWGPDIQRNHKEIIQQVVKIPKRLRTQWGVFKNLLAGITTVANHGDQLVVENPLITVLQEFPSLHSPGFEKNWKWKINLPGNKKPLVIHLGEGTDSIASYEIDQVARWNLFKKDIIAIHGVAMKEDQAAAFRSLVWCPVSNNFLLGKTAAVHLLKNKTKIVFGTDSTLTADWNIWEHLRTARKENKLTDEELLEALTTTAAETWQLSNTGKIEEQYMADIVVARAKNNENFMSEFYQLNPSDILLVMHHGKIRLFDETLLSQLMDSSNNIQKFSKIFIQGAGKYVEGDLAGLMMEIKKYYKDMHFPCSV